MKQIIKCENTTQNENLFLWEQRKKELTQRNYFSWRFPLFWSKEKKEKKQEISELIIRVGVKVCSLLYYPIFFNLSNSALILRYFSAIAFPNDFTFIKCPVLILCELFSYLYYSLISFEKI